MMDEHQSSALEVGKRLARVTAQVGEGDARRDEEIRALMADLILSRGGSPEDALALTIWAYSLLLEIHPKLPADTTEAAELRYIVGIAATLADRAIETLEGVTGIPRAAFSGQDRFSQ